MPRRQQYIPGTSVQKMYPTQPISITAPWWARKGAPVRQGVDAKALSQIRRDAPLKDKRGSKIALYELREKICKLVWATVMAPMQLSLSEDSSNVDFWSEDWWMRPVARISFRERRRSGDVSVVHIGRVGRSYVDCH